jgi:ubiquinone/menaquinone biosynthesis C-methylase UbiE
MSSIGAQVKTSKDFNAALSSIHADYSAATPPQIDSITCKRKIAAMYDGNSGFRSLWNFGMHSEAVDQRIRRAIPAYDAYESDGFSEQLYCYTLQQVPLEAEQGRHILEVGCGQGGGLNFLSRLESRSRFTGLDLSQNAIRHANARFERPGQLTYVQGDAEQLPFDDGKFDVVINIESSHNYPDLRRFLHEVARVLKPGGYLSLVDVFTPERWMFMDRCKRELQGMLRWQQDSDILEDVRRAIRARMDPNSKFRLRRRQSLSLIPRLLFEPFEMFAFGSFLVDSKSGHVNKLYRWRTKNRKVAWGPHVIDSYRHLIARKV